MHHLRSIRRAALGAALAAAAIGAVPAVAGAATTCSYTPSGGGVVTVDADPKLHNMALSVVGQFIVVGTDATPETACVGGGTFGLTTNTNRIQVNANVDLGAFVSSVDYRVDLSRGLFGPGATPESDGNSELETTIFTNAPRSHLSVLGTPQRDVIKVGGSAKRMDVNFGNDNDIDFTIVGRSSIQVSGFEGDDLLSANGNSNGIPGAFAGDATFFGGPGFDNFVGGSGHDRIVGGSEGDTINTAGGGIDEIDGEGGFDDALVDADDTPITSIEALTRIGRLRLTPAALKAEAGEPARLKMSWMHPKSWRALRKIELTVYRGRKAVGTINALPGSGRLSSTGAVDLASGSQLSHRGKWVTANLVVRLPKSLSGQTLSLDVTAVDAKGHKQVERDAGTIRLAA